MSGCIYFFVVSLLKVLHQKMFKLSQELGRMQHEFQEVLAQGSPATEMMKKHMESRTSLFLSYKAAVFEPSLVDHLLQFLAATAHWLIQVRLVYREGADFIIVWLKYSENNNSGYCMLLKIIEKNWQSLYYFALYLLLMPRIYFLVPFYDGLLLCNCINDELKCIWKCGLFVALNIVLTVWKIFLM